eukprot:SAG22_NODE_2016_length_3134_cov_4.981878_2_plen_163_part_00
MIMLAEIYRPLAREEFQWLRLAMGEAMGMAEKEREEMITRLKEDAKGKLESPKLGAKQRQQQLCGGAAAAAGGASVSDADQKDHFAFAGEMYRVCRLHYNDELASWHKQPDETRSSLIPEWRTIPWMDEVRDTYMPCMQMPRKATLALSALRRDRILFPVRC